MKQRKYIHQSDPNRTRNLGGDPNFNREAGWILAPETKTIIEERQTENPDEVNKPLKPKRKTKAK